MTSSRPRLLLALSTLVALALVAPPGSDAASSNKTFTSAATVTNGSGGAATLGTTAALVTFTLTNTTKGPQSFGSANITMPSGVTACTDASCGPRVAPAVSGFSVTRDGQVLALRSGVGSGVLPGSSISVEVWVTSSGGCGAVWSVRVKQSNDFSGVGNDLIGTGTAPGQHLEWTTAPHDTQWNQAMGSQTTPTTYPVVTPKDACGAAVAGVASGVTVTDAATQLSTTGLSTVGSTAVLSNVTFSTYDFTDTLTARLAGYAPATSSSFYVAQRMVFCTDPAAPCDSGSHVSDSGNTTTAGILADPVDTGDGLTGPDTITLSVKGLAAGRCNQPGTSNEPPYGSVVTFDVGLRSKTVTMTLTKQYVNQISNNGTPFMDVCLELPAGSDPFYDKFHYQSSLLSPDPVLMGLLPDCSVTDDDPPCVVSRNKKAAAEIIVFTLDPGDPRASWY